MAISDKTRKNLWAKSGNRCSICKMELFQETNESKELNIGEECHIISKKVKGPRYKEGLSDYDIYDNLILLCRNHHKTVDELVDTFNEEVLRYLKVNHEVWVRETLNKAIDKEKEKTLKPKFLTRIISGKELLNIISDCHGSRMDFEEIENEDEAEYIGGVLQDIFDYGEMSGIVEIYDKVKTSLRLTEIIKGLEQKGYYLFGERNIERLKFENGSIDNWNIATLIVRKKESGEAINIVYEHQIK